MKKVQIILLGLLCCGMTACSAKEQVPPAGGETLPTVGLTAETDIPATPTVASKKEKPVINKVEQGLCEGKTENAEKGALAVYNALNNKCAKTVFTKTDGVVCRDNVTGIVYYVNMGQDYLLYRIKDGEVKLAVELPVSNIEARDGVVYFLTTSYNKYQWNGIREGDICAYYPENGEVKLIYSANASEMKLCEDGIAYITSESKQLEDGSQMVTSVPYFYSFETETVKKDPERLADEVKSGYTVKLDYGDQSEGERISMEGAKAFLLDKKTGDTFAINGEYRWVENYCIYEEQFFYSIGSSIFRVNLTTGEETEYNFVALFPERSKGSIEEFVMTKDGFLRATDKNSIYCLNIETGEQQYYQRAEGKARLGDMFATDGENIYATYYKDFNTDFVSKFVQLTFFQGEDGNGYFDAVYLTE